MIDAHHVSRILAYAFALVGSIALPTAAPAQQQQPARSAPAAPTTTNSANNTWAGLPKMALERQFAGPLQDTVIQRWRDPVDDTVCYIYLPITAPHTPPGPNGFVQYGAGTIGNISCMTREQPTR